uniref:Uncharacterized protein n=1 Tax=Timema douglasi TaxID=61478 RepID=A0A7R8VCF5_TIMDO|nr:unnamed protein product [Timema douglasi]
MDVFFLLALTSPQDHTTQAMAHKMAVFQRRRLVSCFITHMVTPCNDNVVSRDQWQRKLLILALGHLVTTLVPQERVNICHISVFVFKPNDILVLTVGLMDHVLQVGELGQETKERMALAVQCDSFWSGQCDTRLWISVPAVMRKKGGKPFRVKHPRPQYTQSGLEPQSHHHWQSSLLGKRRLLDHSTTEANTNLTTKNESIKISCHWLIPSHATVTRTPDEEHSENRNRQTSRNLMRLCFPVRGVPQTRASFKSWRTASPLFTARSLDARTRRNDVRSRNLSEKYLSFSRFLLAMVRRIALALLVCGLTATVASAPSILYQNNKHEHVRDKCGRFSEQNIATKCVRCSVRNRSTSCRFLPVASKDVRVRSSSSLDASANIVTGRTESHAVNRIALSGNLKQITQWLHREWANATGLPTL